MQLRRYHPAMKHFPRLLQLLSQLADSPGRYPKQLGYPLGGRPHDCQGINPNGQTEAWIATVPEPSTAVLAILACGLMWGFAKSCRFRVGH